MAEYDDRRDDRDDTDRRGSRRDVIADAKKMVSGPAIGLIATGVVSILGVLLSAVQYFTLDAQFEEQKKKFDADPNIQPAQKQQMKDMMDTYAGIIKVAAPPMYLAAAIVGGLTILGGVKMRNLQSPGLAKTSAILSMIPCISGCCFMGIPFGIWAITTLGKPEVKDGFAAVARGGRTNDIADRDRDYDDGDRRR